MDQYIFFGYIYIERNKYKDKNPRKWERKTDLKANRKEKYRKIEINSLVGCKTTKKNVDPLSGRKHSYGKQSHQITLAIETAV